MHFFSQGHPYIWHTTSPHNKQTIPNHAVLSQLLCSGYAPSFSSVLQQLQFKPCSLVTYRRVNGEHWSTETKVGKRKYGSEKKSCLWVSSALLPMIVSCSQGVTVSRQCESRILTHRILASTNTVLWYDTVCVVLAHWEPGYKGSVVLSCFQSKTMLNVC